MPPVLAGMPSGAGPQLSKQERYDARMRKLDAARAQLAANPVLAPNPLAAPADATRVAPSARVQEQRGNQERLQRATDRLARNNVAVERAKLADDSYENDLVMGPNGSFLKVRPKNTPLPEGWQVDCVIKNKDSGFMAVVYKSNFERPHVKSWPSAAPTRTSSFRRN